jgi:hypothetical protein
MLAEAGDVWQYIDPAGDQVLKKPEKPQSPFDTPPTPDGASSTDTQATTAQELDVYKVMNKDYYQELKEYWRKQDKLYQIVLHMGNTIHQDLRYHIMYERTTRAKLKVLQRHYSLTRAEHKDRAQRRYNAAKVFDPKRQRFENWADNFLWAYLRADQLKLPEAHGFRAQKDLIQAIKAVDPSYAGVLSAEVFRAEQRCTRETSVNTELLQVPTLISSFRWDCTMFSTSTESSIQTEAFEANLNRQTSPHSNATAGQKRSYDSLNQVDSDHTLKRPRK